ncbi:26250_t:CDS:1 [Gigaspora margarita]|uniref:26250_t:CDS:1 n=1 Tax=Gigaspora margarita TaxID=4874 RepID=A0ABM8VVK2_GIGMA|nr:26250_t:CDS:1 [Gigaspora margarita]
MNENQTPPPAIHMQIDNYAMGNNSSNVVNNYPSPPRQTTSREEYNDTITIPNFPNQVKEALTTIKKYLARQPTSHEIKISKETIIVNGKLLELDYEACKICKNQPSNFTCPQCQRKVCSKCVIKRSDKVQCFRCKNSKKVKDKLNSEFEDKITRLLKLESNDKIREVVLAEVENLGGKSLEELIEVVRKLEIRSDKLDRSISLAYFYVGKIFYEKMEEFFSESDLEGGQKDRKILASFRHAKDLDFGKERMSIQEIKEKLSVDDNKVSRFFGLTLKVFLTYKNFGSSEEQIRKAESIPSSVWLRDLSQEKFLDFLGKLKQREREEEL